MAMLSIAILSIWQYQEHVRYAWKSKICLSYLYATTKREIQICSNKHETGLVELKPHATELIFLMPVPANKMQLFPTK